MENVMIKTCKTVSFVDDKTMIQYPYITSFNHYIKTNTVYVTNLPGQDFFKISASFWTVAQYLISSSCL